MYAVECHDEKGNDTMRLCSTSIGALPALQCLLQMPKLHRSLAFAVLSAVRKANLVWSMCSRHRDTLVIPGDLMVKGRRPGWQCVEDDLDSASPSRSF